MRYFIVEHIVTGNLSVIKAESVDKAIESFYNLREFNTSGYEEFGKEKYLVFKEDILIREIDVEELEEKGNLIIY